MFNNLIESKPKRQKSIGQSFLSLVLHGLVIFGAVKATQGVAETVRDRPIDTTLVFLKPPEPAPPPPAPPPEEVIVSANPPPKGFQTVVVPDEIPTEIPPVNLNEKFDPRDFTGKGVEGGVAVGIEGGVGPVEPVTGEVFLEAQVDEPLQYLTKGPLRYPPVMQQMGVPGKVTLEFVVNTDGHADPATIKVLESSHKAFEEPAREFILKSVFKPGRVKGTPVRLKAVQTVSFKIA